MEGKDIVKVKQFLKQYSIDDLAKSFFVLNLWLPNIASPIKIQYLYICLEAFHDQLQVENRIKTYEDFRSFCVELFKLVPSFPTLEDYMPETDWGEIKYYLDKKFYKIFYGGDLSNPYDFYYSYELIHKPFEQNYLDLIKRSPVTEMRFCLGLQNYILSNLKQESPTLEDVRPGHIEIPSCDFWRDTTTFLESYKSDDFSPDILGLFTKELDKPMKFPSMTTFVENAFRGRNCRYFFIKKGKKVYPVMPRKWLTVIYDKWGALLRDNYSKIVKELKDGCPNVFISIKIGHFIGERIDEKYVFNFVAPVDKDHKPPNELVYIAVRAKDKLYLIYVTPPVFDHKELHKHLEEIAPKLKESADLVRSAPTRLGQFAEKRIVEFRSKKTKILEPVFIIALPSPISDVEGTIKIPEGVEAEIMTLDQLAGIFDEIEEPKELNDFIDYITEERKQSRIPALSSYLDRFGSFKDSYGVLVPGALEPNMIMLDFGWGSGYRYKSLKKFWVSYPEKNLFGHPRSWKIPEERKTATGLILVSKNFFGYAYFQKIENATFFINAPVNRMEIEEGGFTDTLMHALFDAIDNYIDILKGLDISKSHNKVQLFFCPLSLASTDPDLSHLKHLIQDQKLWEMDSIRIRSKDFAIRIVFNKDEVQNALKDVKDRSSQVSLLMDVLKKLNEVFPEPNLEWTLAQLEAEKNKKPRFGSFAVEKRASFPQHVRIILPEEREYKLADKEIAKIAHKLKIEPGDYTAKEAQEKLNLLRAEIVKTLDEKIKCHNFSESLPVLLEKSNALINDVWRIESELKATRDHDVDYKASERLSEKEKEFLHWYRVYRYIIEKFVQHQPSGEQELNDTILKEILGLVDRLMDLYTSSDFINYQIYPVNVTINHDYLVIIKNKEHNISRMEKEYGEEQAKLNLGIIGNKDDTTDSSLPIEEYFNKLDEAFVKDLGFGFRNLVDVQQVLALWAEIAKVPEATHYIATTEKINEICSAEIKGYNESETQLIVDFLTLKVEELLSIKGDKRVPDDLPVWEHNKRLVRFDIRPLIKVNDRYCWGPHSIERASRIWMGISIKHKLPSDIDAPTVNMILDKGHKSLEQNLENRIVEITKRYTPHVKPNVSPHDYDKSIGNIGDCDTLAFLEDKNIILNIESKIIDPPYSAKDSGRVQKKIFNGHTDSKGVYRKCYVEKVENREKYLKLKGVELFNKLKWSVKDNPEVISIFVTKIGFWWTKHPPITTNVKFVEIRLLDDFIKNM